MKGMYVSEMIEMSEIMYYFLLEYFRKSEPKARCVYHPIWVSVTYDTKHY